jgi:membrane fusion protein (multidrug efflux system)
MSKDFIGAWLVAVSIAALAACSAPAPPPAPPPVEVAVVTLKAEPVVLTTVLAGRTTLSLSSDVRPQVAGLVKSRKFEEGSLVKAGQLLYEIDPAQFRAAADQAAASLANAEAAVSSAQLKDKRYAELAAIEGVSKQDADAAHVAYVQAVALIAQQKAALAAARINLDYTMIRAPISGRIGISSVTPGALVSASQTTALATIRVLDPIFVDLTQSSTELLQLRRSLAAGALHAGSAVVSLRLEDGSIYASRGRLKFSEVAVDAATGSVTLRAEFPNAAGTLLPGMYVRAELAQAVDPGAILAPQQGITRDPKGNATAMIVDADGRVRTRSATTTRAIGDKWLVSWGLSAGDRLVVQGSNKIRDGDVVRVVDAAAAAPAASSATPSPASAPKGT